VLILAGVAVAQPRRHSRTEHAARFAGPSVRPGECRIDQRSINAVPLDLEFKDETGKTVNLGDYFHSGRPVISEPGVLHLSHACGEEWPARQAD